MRAAIYLRQSLDKTGEELGIQRQEVECQRLCAQRGYKIEHVLVDNSVSASSKVRPSYDELKQLIATKSIDVVVVYRLDRLLRKLTDLEQLIELTEQTGVIVVTVQGDIDLSTSTGRLVGRLLASVARAEVETKGERHRLANAQKAQKGLPHVSRRPYGYEPDAITLRRSEALILRQMARLLVKGYSYKDISAWANAQGHTTTLGKQWYPVTVRNLLIKPRYRGLREHNGVLYPAQWQPVFDAELGEQVVLTYKLRQARKDGHKIPRKYLLTGIAVCGQCGMGLNGQMKRDNPSRPLRPTYACLHCFGVTRNADALDDLITRAVIHRLDTPELTTLLSNNAELSQLLEERARLQARLTGLIDDYATGLLTKAQLRQAKQTIEVTLNDLERKIDTTTSTRGIPSGQSLRTAWEQNESLSWRRQVLSMLIKRIIVNAGITKPYYYLENGTRARFDPSLIDVEWQV